MLYIVTALRMRDEFRKRFTGKQKKTQHQEESDRQGMSDVCADDVRNISAIVITVCAACQTEINPSHRHRLEIVWLSVRSSDLCRMRNIRTTILPVNDASRQRTQVEPEAQGAGGGGNAIGRGWKMADVKKNDEKN